MTRIAVIDYGMGNLRSVAKALHHASPEDEVYVTSKAADVARADKVVFPGQGAMRGCMAGLDQHGLRDAVLHAARNKPFFGVCMGLQLLFDVSEEGGNLPGLGIIPGKVKRFDVDSATDGMGRPLKVPHMGWNEVNYQQEHPLWRGIADTSRFYFVHSYFAQPTNPAHVAATSDYPGEFACAVATDNIFATQFHPEKSSNAGLTLYRNFIHWKP
jgi:imidazole glycerol-phosphate synthase subunit HisH